MFTCLCVYLFMLCVKFFVIKFMKSELGLGFAPNEKASEGV